MPVCDSYHRFGESSPRRRLRTQTQRVERGVIEHVPIARIVSYPAYDVVRDKHQVMRIAAVVLIGRDLAHGPLAMVGARDVANGGVAADAADDRISV